MGKKWIFLAVCLLTVLSAKSQYVIKNPRELENLKKLPQEKVYVHHTGPLVFVGEYLKYAFYCFNTQSNKLSDISYVGYVALVNEQGEYLLEQKIPLDEGVAQGDFFINTEVPSGNYKLLAYTQWMKNNGLDQVFKGDLVIINPYQVDQSGLLQKKTGEEGLHESMASTEQVMDSSIVQARMGKTAYGPREKVKFTLRNYKAALGKGNYSLRIQKKSPFTVAPSMNAMEFVPAYLNVAKQINNEVGNYIFLPEQQGELFFGKAVDSETGNPSAGTRVVMSIPGDPYFLESVKTNADGGFYVYVHDEYKNAQALFQTDDDSRVRLEFGTPKKLDVSGLTFQKFELKRAFAEAIKERSVHNQIENQFFSVKPDSVIVENVMRIIDRPSFGTFHLDDYTRFPTLQETMVEILSYVGFRNNGNGADYIHVTQLSEDYSEDFIQTPSIVLVDGVFIPNHEVLKDFDARLIKTIRVSQEKFPLGDKTYQGMVQMETMEGDYFSTYEPSNGIKVPIQIPLPKKNYFQQSYDSGDSDSANIPDYRSLLFWAPHIEVGETDMEFEFFTSDLTGTFEVILDGFTSYGKPVYNKSTIIVE